MKSWNVVCDRCGFLYKAEELFKEWTGHMVCRKCLDPRDFESRPKQERVIYPYPEPQGSNVGIPLQQFLLTGLVQIVGSAFTINYNASLNSGSLAVTGADLTVTLKGIAIIAGGSDQNVGTFDSADKFNFVDNTTVTTTSLPSAIAGDPAQWATGTRLDGYWLAGTFANKINFIDETWTAAANNINRAAGATTGKEDTAVTMGGSSDGSASNTIELFEFATETSSDSSATLGGTNVEAAFCNSTIALCFRANEATDKYTWATDSRAAGTSLGKGATWNWISGSSSKTNGYLVAGHTGGFFGAETEVHRYNYANETWHDAGILFGEVGERGLYQHTCCTNPFNLLVSGGQDLSASASETDQQFLYNFATETTLNLGSSLTEEKAFAGSCASFAGNY